MAKTGKGHGNGVKVPRRGDSELTESSCYQSNHSKLEEIPLNALPKNTSELAG